MKKTQSYEIIRSNRKTIALVVDSNATLIIRAPFSVSDKEIKEIITKKQFWIAEKKKQIENFGVNHPKVEIENGAGVMYLGNSYTIAKEAVSDFKVVEPFIYAPVNATVETFTKWLKDEALIILTERVKRYASIMGVEYSKLSLSDAFARWGSCSNKNSLNFAWRLVMCPIIIIDYVVVHELSHITYKNHSSLFWARVKTIIPNCNECQEWLKVNRKLMEII
jgi:predicted metal-dependent hydrolase